MGWFDGASDMGGGSHGHGHHHRSSSKHHSSPRASSIFGGGDHKHNSSRSSIFGGGDNKHNSSRSSFFGFNSGRSSSYYKRSPRQGYVKRVYNRLRRLLRDLVYYMKRHPAKVFILVIMPLVTGGALTGLLSKFGIRLPSGLEKMFGMARGGTSINRGYDGNMQWERSSVESHGGGFGGMSALGGIGSAIGGLGGLGGAASLAKMFM